jgi:hypothetical protein
VRRFGGETVGVNLSARAERPHGLGISDRAYVHEVGEVTVAVASSDFEQK